MKYVLMLVISSVGVGAVFAQAAPVKRVVVVAADGSGDYREVQAAVDAAPAQGLVVRIKPGIYKQKLHIDRNGVELHGLGGRPEDVVLSWDDAAKTSGGTSKSGSVTVTGDDFYAENLTIENSWERGNLPTQEGSQAVALLVSGDREVFRKVRLLGYQDTLYANSKTCHSGDEVTKAAPCRASRQYFVDCYIEGHVDFIFGDAKAVFDHCELHGMAHPTVMLSAQSRVYPAEDSGYLFYGCKVTAADGVKNLLLGRPWRAYSTVTFYDTEFVAKLNPVGWSDWDGRLKTSTYAEYGSTGNIGDLALRLAGTRVLTADEAAKISVKGWLAGPDGWDATKVR